MYLIVTSKMYIYFSIRWKLNYQTDNRIDDNIRFIWTRRVLSTHSVMHDIDDWA